MIFSELPWKVSSVINNFVPSHLRLFELDKETIVIAWRKNVSIVLTFSTQFVSSAAVNPKTNQVIRTSEDILDIVKIENCVFFIHVSGLFQAMHRVRKRSAKDQFHLTASHELSPLKSILAVCKIKAEKRSLDGIVNFCAVTCSKDGGEIQVELYCISVKSQLKADFKLISVHTIPYKAPFKFYRKACVVVHCSKKQANALFKEYNRFEVLLLGFQSGHLFCVPHHLSAHDVESCPTPRLIYQSPLAIDEVFFPRDGTNIMLSVDGGIFIVITSASHNHKGEKFTPLSYKTITTPCHMKHVCVPNSNLILCSNGVDLWQLQPSTSDFSDATVLPVKGVTALFVVDETDLILAATVHCMFYKLSTGAEKQNPSQENKSHHSEVWSGANLNRSLQYVGEMKEQTELLSRLRLQQETEDAFITALSIAARAQLLVDFFIMSIKVDTAWQSPQSCNNAWNDPFSAVAYDNWEYNFTIEISNNSNEEFLSSIWGICVEIENPCGKNISRHEPLTRSFGSGAPFSTVITISFLSEEIIFPLKVKTYLLSKSNDEDVLGGQWSTVPLGEVILDVSYFIMVATQVPLLFSKERSNFLSFIEKINFNNIDKNTLKHEARELQVITHNISIPESARHITLILDKLLENCKHRVDRDMLEKHLNERNNDNSIWIGVHGNFVQLTFRKSCSSLSISSSNVELLHLLRSWIVVVIIKITDNTKVSNNVAVKAKNLKAMLEMQHFEEEDSSKHLLTIYQELRNSISCDMY